MCPIVFSTLRVKSDKNDSLSSEKSKFSSNFYAYVCKQTESKSRSILIGNELLQNGIIIDDRLYFYDAVNVVCTYISIVL